MGKRSYSITFPRMDDDPRERNRKLGDQYEPQRRAELARKAAALGLEYVLRDGEAVARAALREAPACVVDWYLRTGQVVRVGSVEKGRYCYDSEALARLLVWLNSGGRR